MANMSYCRFHNTYLALKDCYANLEDMIEGIEQSGPESEEARACVSLIALCRRIAKEVPEDLI